MKPVTGIICHNLRDEFHRISRDRWIIQNINWSNGKINVIPGKMLFELTLHEIYQRFC